MKDVATYGRTVLFVSHNMDVIQALCPRTILLRNAELAEDGSVENVISKYMADAHVSVMAI